MDALFPRVPRYALKHVPLIVSVSRRERSDGEEYDQRPGPKNIGPNKRPSEVSGHSHSHIVGEIRRSKQPPALAQYAVKI